MRNTSNYYSNVWYWSGSVALMAVFMTLILASSSTCLAQKPTTLRRIEIVGLKKLSSDKVIAASGLIDNGKYSGLGATDPAVRAVLAKPYTAEKLLHTLYEVLTGTKWPGT